MSRKPIISVSRYGTLAKSFVNPSTLITYYFSPVYIYLSQLAMSIFHYSPLFDQSYLKETKTFILSYFYCKV